MARVHYETAFKEKGVNVRPDQARKYRQLLLQDEFALPYLKDRLNPALPDTAWMLKISQDAPRRKELTGQRVSEESQVDAMLKDAQEVFAIEPVNEMLAALADWFDRWVGPSGLKSLRNSINSKVFYNRSKKRPISLYEDTYQRMNQLLEATPEAKSFDDLQNMMMHHFEIVKGLKRE